MIRLKNKYSLITGASSGIGKALTYKYAEEGSNLIIIARNKKLLSEIKKNIQLKFNIQIHIFAIDISKELEIKKLKKFLNTNNIKLNNIINCAAVLGDGGKIENISTKSWDYTIKVNLYGAFFLFKYLIDLMSTNSLFVNFSGGGGTLPQPLLDSYAASKAAVVRLTENVSLSHYNAKKCFVSISPGGVNTRIFNDMKKLGKNKLGSKLWKEIQNRIKFGGDNIQNPINLIIFLSKLKDKNIFNGRVISAKYDDWSFIVKKADKLKKNDLFKLRRVDLTNSKFSLK